MVEEKERSWLQLKYYQYELNTGIYMLEPWERKLFNFLLLGFILMSLVSSYFFMPASIRRGMDILGVS